MASTRALRADLAGFQEVNFQKQQHAQIAQTTNTTCFPAPLTMPYLVDGDPSFRIDGNCVCAGENFTLLEYDFRVISL